MKSMLTAIRPIVAFATIALLPITASATAAKTVAPFGLAIGVFDYEQTVKRLTELEWPFSEYEKKQFKALSPQAAQRGKNTFFRIAPSRLDGVRGLLAFFGPDQKLQALLINLEPHLFAATMTDLDQKYQLVRKKLAGQSFSTDHPYVLYEKDNVYIELQMYSPHRVRLLYTEKLLWENYREFLQKDYEPFRNNQNRKTWMDDL